MESLCLIWIHGLYVIYFIKCFLMHAEITYKDRKIMSIYKNVVGHGKDIVLIHGWGCDHRHMAPIADMLTKNYRVTNIDLPGIGKSTWNSNIKNIHNFADILLPHLPEQAIYIPWSFGGLVTISLAARHRSRVEKIIGITTSPKFIEDKNWPGVPLPGFKEIFSNMMRKIGFKAFFEGFYDSEFSDIDPKPENYFKLKKMLVNLPPEKLEILLEGINICDTADLRSEFQSLSCPIDFILGGKDESIPVASHEHIKQLNSNLNLHVILEAKHMPFWTHPKLFQEELKKCL